MAIPHLHYMQSGKKHMLQIDTTRRRGFTPYYYDLELLAEGSV